MQGIDVAFRVTMSLPSRRQVYVKHAEEPSVSDVLPYAPSESLPTHIVNLF